MRFNPTPSPSRILKVLRFWASVSWDLQDSESVQHHQVALQGLMATRKNPVTRALKRDLPAGIILRSPSDGPASGGHLQRPDNSIMIPIMAKLVITTVIILIIK